MNEEELAILDYIKYVQSLVDFQVTNSLLTLTESDEIRKKLYSAQSNLQKNNPLADQEAHEAYAKFQNYIDNKGIKRFWFLYATHIWVYLIGLTVALFWIIASALLNFEVIPNLSFSVIAWGGLGGIAYSIFYLRKSIYEYHLSKYYATYWFAYPIAGMIFGLAITAAISAGLLAFDAKPAAGFFESIAFLAGMFQQWALSVLNDVANAIHKTSIA